LALADFDQRRRLAAHRGRSGVRWSGPVRRTAAAPSRPHADRPRRAGSANGARRAGSAAHRAPACGARRARLSGPQSTLRAGGVGSGHSRRVGIPQMIALALDRVSRDFVAPDGRSYRAIDDVSLAIPSGAFVALVGPSGCGKSTLLNIAAGLVAPTLGQVYVAGEELRGLNRHATYMFQQDALLPWKDVRDNVALGLTLGGIARAEAHARTEQ